MRRFRAKMRLFVLYITIFPMTDVYAASIALHAKHHGKIATQTIVPLENKNDLAVAYSPGVAAVCKAIAANPADARALTIKHNTIAIVSDGSAILGLGNLGATAAIPVMEGKAALFKRFGNVDAFPICLDTQDPEEIIETVKRIAPVFGGINVEDISAPRCFGIEQRLRAELAIPVMHDDQHGTATVVLAGLINALKIRGGAPETLRVVINGVGAAGIAIANILETWGVRDLVLCDSTGVISQVRTDLTDVKKVMCAKTNPRGVTGGFADAIAGADVFVGVSVAGALTAEHIATMADDPIIFALANPEPEIMPDAAKKAGARIVATGRSDFPNQVNNVLAFPGLFRGALDHNIGQFTPEIFVRAAHAIAGRVITPTAEHIIPDPFTPDMAQTIADAMRTT